MMGHPSIEKKPKKRGLFIAISILAMFLTAWPLSPAQGAAVNATIVADPASQLTFLEQLEEQTTIAGVLGVIWTFIQQLLPNVAAGIAGVAGAVNAGLEIVTSTLYQLGDFLAAFGMQQIQTNLTAIHNGDATLPDQTVACQWAQEGVSRGQMAQCVRTLAAANVGLLTSDCQGVGADCNGPMRNWERLYDAGKLGLIDRNDIPAIFDQFNFATPPQGYVNRHMNMAACLSTDQMTLPTSVCVLQDHYLAWYGPTQNQDGSFQQCLQGQGGGYQYNADTTQSSLAWIACYKACENLDPQNYPSSVGQATNQAVAQYLATWAPRQRSLNARAACMLKLWERTAIPAGAGQVIQAIAGQPAPGGNNGQASCAQYQQNECYALGNLPNADNGFQNGGPSGGQPVPTPDQVAAGGTGTGAGFDDPLVQNCVNNNTGLSLRQAENVVTHRGTSTAHVGIISNISGNTAQSELWVQEQVDKQIGSERQDDNWDLSGYETEGPRWDVPSYDMGGGK